MTARRIIPRRRAETDIEHAIDHYLVEGGPELALRFIDALEAAFQHLKTHPDSGSPRYANELGLPGLRSWPLNQFPYLIFFVETAGVVDVWRVLHAKRDIPASMQTDE